MPPENLTLNGNGAAPKRAREDGGSLNQRGKRIQELIEQIETLPDPAARGLMQECMQSVLGFYGDGLARVLEVVQEAGADGEKVFQSLIGDETVRGLLLIHGLHPVDLETRLRQALDKVRPYMESHGGNVELIRLENDYAQLRLEGHCKTCPSSAVTLELAVRQAIEEACPDLQGFDVEGMPEVTEPDAPAAPENFTHSPNTAPSWTTIDGTETLADGGLLSRHVAGVSLLLCKIEGQLYAYRDQCPACNLPLHLGALAVEGGILSCRASHRYDVRRAGRSPDEPGRHLDPFPLLNKDGVVKVALSRESH
jgi:Fe-S cluster biogenesis protein NfuA/nitrite reductase/ring-hydroxylating ferredoxin subunit